eukprot:6102090-Amphidinium_carterae.1
MVADRIYWTLMLDHAVLTKDCNIIKRSDGIRLVRHLIRPLLYGSLQSKGQDGVTITRCMCMQFLTREDGKSPAEVAEEHGHPNVVKYLKNQEKKKAPKEVMLLLASINHHKQSVAWVSLGVRLLRAVVDVVVLCQ